jgi:hypothetical protein
MGAVIAVVAIAGIIVAGLSYIYTSSQGPPRGVARDRRGHRALLDGAHYDLAAPPGTEPRSTADVCRYVHRLRMPAMPGDKPREKPEPRLNRRAILIGSTAAVQLPLLEPAQAERPRSQPTQDARQPHYRETEHIRTFYDRSRF